MEVEWDIAKAVFNLNKHGIDFADAVTVLYDDLSITVSDPHSAEERFITLGMDAQGRILVIVYTWRRDHFRLISARKATPRERKQYEEKR